MPAPTAIKVSRSSPPTSSPGEEVKIFHVPSLDFSGDDHRIPNTPLLWSFAASAAGLKRVQPNFSTSGITERIDLRPELSLPFTFERLAHPRQRRPPRNRLLPLPQGALRQRRRSHRTRIAPQPHQPSTCTSTSARPPSSAPSMSPRNGSASSATRSRHTIEPQIVYNNVRGINNFLSVLRFDDVDLASDTRTS